MIFVTLGSQKFNFNRLLKKVDDLIEDGVIQENVFAQLGYSDYKPKHYRYKDFMEKNEFLLMIESSNIVISHGGTATIISAVKMKKKVVSVPRLAKYGEHVDDHQIQLIQQFDNMNLIYGCRDCDDLKEALRAVKEIEYNSYESNTQTIINSIESLITSL